MEKAGGGAGCWGGELGPGSGFGLCVSASRCGYPQAVG